MSNELEWKIGRVGLLIKDEVYYTVYEAKDQLNRLESENAELRERLKEMETTIASSEVCIEQLQKKNAKLKLTTPRTDAEDNDEINQHNIDLLNPPHICFKCGGMDFRKHNCRGYSPKVPPNQFRKEGEQNG